MAKHAGPPEVLSGFIPGVNESAAAITSEPVFEIDVTPKTVPAIEPGRARPITEGTSIPCLNSEWSRKIAIIYGAVTGGMLGVGSMMTRDGSFMEAAPAVAYVASSGLRNVAQRMLPDRVGERLEAYELESDGHIDVRWHPTPGKSPAETDESLRRVVAWAVHSSKVSSLALPMREAERVAPIVERIDESRWPVVDWTEDVLRKKYPDLRSRGKDLVYRATPADWAELVTETETVTQAEHEWQSGVTRIVERIRTLDPDSPLVLSYDAHADNEDAQYEVLDEIVRTQMLRELEYADRIRLGATEVAAHGGDLSKRVSVSGTLGREDPMTVLWREANGALVQQPLADALELTDTQRDFEKLLAEGEHVLTPREIIRALTYHLYKDSVSWAGYGALVKVMREVERQKPLSMPMHSGERPKLIRSNELGYSRARLHTKLAAFALGAAILAGGAVKGAITGVDALSKESFAQSQIYSGAGDRDSAPGGANYADWQLSSHDMSTEGYWTQTTSDTLTSAGYWTPDTVVGEDRTPFPMSANLPAGHSKYIEVTDVQANLGDSMAYDSSGRPIMLVPVLNGSLIDAVSVNGKPAQLELLENNSYAIVLPTGEGIDSVRYWLVPDESASNPSAVGVIQTTPKVDTAAMQQVWQRHGYDPLNVAEVATIVRKTAQYSLTPFQFQPSNGASWSSELNQWLNTGEIVDCEIASTITALTYPGEVNIASGDLVKSPTANAIGLAEGHQWTVAPDGSVIDATPANASPAVESYLNAPVIPRPPVVTFVERLGSFMKNQHTKDAGIALVGLSVAASLFRRRKAIVHSAQAKREAYAQRILDYRLERQTARVDAMGEVWERTGYVLLNRLVHSPHKHDFHGARLLGRHEDSKAEAQRDWLPQRMDFTNANAQRNLKEATRHHAKTKLDKRTVRAARQVMRLAKLMQRAPEIPQTDALES